MVSAQPFSLTLPLAPVETFLLIATRLLAALATSPVLGARLVPGPARIGLGLFTALVLLPVIAADPASQAARLTWTTLAGEAVAGALAGFVATLVYGAVQFGGGLLDVQAGFALGSVYDPALGSAGSTIERFYATLATLLFFQVNAHLLVLGALRELFAVVPLGAFSLDLLRPGVLAAVATGMLRVALQLVLPVLGALLLTDVALALLARAAPQFSVWAVGLQAKMFVALGALLVTLPLVLPRLEAIAVTAAGAMAGFAR